VLSQFVRCKRSNLKARAPIFTSHQCSVIALRTNLLKPIFGGSLILQEARRSTHAEVGMSSALCDELAAQTTALERLQRDFSDIQVTTAPLFSVDFQM